MCGTKTCRVRLKTALIFYACFITRLGAPLDEGIRPAKAHRRRREDRTSTNKSSMFREMDRGILRFNKQGRIFIKHFIYKVYRNPIQIYMLN